MRDARQRKLQAPLNRLPRPNNIKCGRRDNLEWNGVGREEHGGAMVSDQRVTLVVVRPDAIHRESDDDDTERQERQLQSFQSGRAADCENANRDTNKQDDGPNNPSFGCVEHLIIIQRSA